MIPQTAVPGPEVVRYRASATLTAFHRSNAPIRFVRGPVGSGKSTAMCWEIWRRAHEQKPGADGWRRTRWAIIRNTYRELIDTTAATWSYWFSEGRVGSSLNRSSMDHVIRLHDSQIECDLLFRSLDKPADVKKLLSLDLTGAWINEAREIPQGIVQPLFDRTGRFPRYAPDDGEPGATWRGVMGDTNPGDEDHYLTVWESDPPQLMEFFVQPPAIFIRDDGSFEVNPRAENIRYLRPGYYSENAALADDDHRRVYYGNLPGFVMDGKPVIPEFRRDLHVSHAAEPMKDLAVAIGLDIGGGTLNPSAVFLQRHPRGPWMVQHEIVASDLGADTMGRLISQTMAEHYPVQWASRLGERPMVEAWADPSCTKRDEIYEEVVADHLKKVCGIKVRPAPSQDPHLRIEAIKGPLQRLVDGKPGLLVHPRCRTLVKALAGGWSYRKLQVVGRTSYATKPDKGPYSHVAESLGYVLLSKGELHTLRTGEEARARARGYGPPPVAHGVNESVYS